VFLNPFIHLKENIHSSEKKNIKKYSDLEKKKNFARRTKSFDLYCVVGIVHPSATKHSFIKEKKHKKIFRSRRRIKDMREEPSKKNKSFNLYCVLDTFYLSAKKHSFIRGKQT